MPSVVVATLCGLLAAGSAWALPHLGAVAPNARAETVGGKHVSLQAFAGRPILVIYEGPGAQRENRPLKDDLIRLERNPQFRAAVVIFPVADVRRYDHWPLRHLVRKRIRQLEKREHHVIYVDWNGAFARALGMHAEASNVVLIAPNGRVVFANAGPLSLVERIFVEHTLIRLARGARLRAEDLVPPGP